MTNIGRLKLFTYYVTTIAYKQFRNEGNRFFFISIFILCHGIQLDARLEVSDARTQLVQTGIPNIANAKQYLNSAVRGLSTGFAQIILPA